MKKQFLNFTDYMARLYPEVPIAKPGDDNYIKDKRLSRTFTFQVTDKCNLACTYCYQINKGVRRMSFETAKEAVDCLLTGNKGFKDYINPETSPAIILEFIGGEPFLEIDLIDQVVDYFRERAIELDHPWQDKFMISICSNGVLYRDPKVQKFIQKNERILSFSVTVDGTKELHDACRIFPDGRPSYDLAHDAAMDWMHRGYYMGSKITISPDNITYLSESLKQMVKDGYYDINANCIYEKGWELKHATELYKQSIDFIDYFLKNCDYKDYTISLFDEKFGKPKAEDDLNNWCWGAGTPILTTRGYIPIEQVKIGDFVYTEDGTIHPVINKKEHFADNCVKISASGIFEMICTDNHKLFAMPLDHIGNNYKKHYKNYNKYQVKELKNKDMICMSKLPNTRTVDYNKDIAYIIGRYIADGWHGIADNSYSICSNPEKVHELKEKLCAQNIKHSIYENKGLLQIRISNKNAELCNILKSCGELAHNKHIPEECLLWNDESLKELIKGYLKGDGHLKNNRLVSFNTVSQRLAHELMLILRTLGFNPTCYLNKRKGKSTIQNREVDIRDRYEVYFYIDNTSNRYIKRLNNKVWTTNLHVSAAEPQTVYNLTVDTNHSYFAGGLVSSNCGGVGFMLAIDPVGDLYPCIRYMESSLGTSREPLKIGNIKDGLMVKPCEKKCVECMNKVTRRSQSTDECFYCPIASGCSWCSAYNYQETGSFDKRITYICEMHKARCLAIVYMMNKYYLKEHDNDPTIEPKDLWVPKQWAVPIIGEEEYNKLVELTKQCGGYVNENATMIKCPTDVDECVKNRTFEIIK